MLLSDLFENMMPLEASIQRNFDFMMMDNRRFIFDPISRRFVVGAFLPKSKTLIGSHAEEWFDATGSNDNFDRCIRGWMCGQDSKYKNGLIHFAPPVDPYGDGTWKCLKYFITMLNQE